MPKKPDPNQKDLTPCIYVGEDKDGNPVGIEEESLLENGLLIIGSKNSGKEEILKKIAFYEVFAPFTTVDGVNRMPFSKACVTFILSKPGLSYYFYAIPKKWKRNEGTKLITPATNMKVRNELLGMKSFDYDKINEILNFTKLCKNKNVAVIDMENFRYEEASVRAVGMLLLNLQISMHDTNNTGGNRHYLTIDDAWNYLPYLESILKYGSSYNLSTILAFDSRSQYKEYETVVENNLQNILIMGNLRYEDAKYYSDRFEIPLKELLEGGKDHFYLASYDKDMRFNVKKCFVNDKPIDEKDDKLLIDLARKYKREMMKASADEEYVKDIMLAYATCIAEQNKDFEIGTTKDSMQRVAKELEAEENAKKTTIKKQELVPQDEVVTTSKEETLQNLEEESSDNVQLIGSVKKTPIVPHQSAESKQPQRKSASLDGLRALMGIVDEAPARIQKQLKEEGFPLEEKKSEQPPKTFKDKENKAAETEKKQDNIRENQKQEKKQETRNSDSFNPFGKTMCDIARARAIDMPAYVQSESFTKKQKAKNGNVVKNQSVQNQQSSEHKKKKKKKKKKTRANIQNVELNEKAKNTAFAKDDDNANNNSKSEKVNEKSEKTVEMSNTGNSIQEVPRSTLEASQSTVNKVVNKTAEANLPETEHEETFESLLTIAQEDIVIEEESSDSTDKVPNDTNQIALKEENKDSKLINSEESVGASKKAEVSNEILDAEATYHINKHVEDKVNAQEEILDLFGDEEDCNTSLFNSDDDEDIEMSQNGLKEDNFNNVGLSDKLATLSVQPRSSGENFSAEENTANELIDRLKERGRNTNFFSKRREIELLKNDRNR